MTMIIVLPFLFDLQPVPAITLMTLSIIYFGLHLMSFLWAIAFWMDNHLMALMTEGGRYGIFEPIAPRSEQDHSMDGRFLYLIFPMMFWTGLGWAGIHAGAVATQLNTFGER